MYRAVLQRLRVHLTRCSLYWVPLFSTVFFGVNYYKISLFLDVSADGIIEQTRPGDATETTQEEVTTPTHVPPSSSSDATSSTSRTGGAVTQTNIGIGTNVGSTTTPDPLHVPLAAAVVPAVLLAGVVVVLILVIVAQYCWCVKRPAGDRII